MDFRRYAIFVTPPPGPLADATAAWLGWDARAGVEVAHPEIKGLPATIADITATPRKYGFHGTVKPPFRLAEGTRPAALIAAFEALAATLPPVRIARLEVADLGGFVALRPVGDTAALDALAARVVADLDRFRAPPEPDELARRRAAGLSAAQDALLQRWGYPYVMEAFRYHMTLTGRLEPAARAEVVTALQAHLGPLLPAPYPVDALTLMGEAPDGRLREILRAPLGGVAAHSG